MKISKAQMAKYKRELKSIEKAYGWDVDSWEGNFEDIEACVEAGHLYTEGPFQPLMESFIKHLMKVYKYPTKIKAFDSAWGTGYGFETRIEYEKDIKTTLKPYEIYLIDTFPDSPMLGPVEILCLDLRIILKNLEEINKPFKHKKYDVFMMEKIGIEVPTSVKFILDLEKESLCYRTNSSKLLKLEESLTLKA